MTEQFKDSKLSSLMAYYLPETQTRPNIINPQEQPLVGYESNGINKVLARVESNRYRDLYKGLSVGCEFEATVEALMYRIEFLEKDLVALLEYLASMDIDPLKPIILEMIQQQTAKLEVLRNLLDIPIDYQLELDRQAYKQERLSKQADNN